MSENTPNDKSKKPASPLAPPKVWTPAPAYKGVNKGSFAKPVSDFITKVLDPVIARKAGMDMDLIAAWEDIVGETHAAYTVPEKLNWPRKAHQDDPFKPATLVVACDGARAVYFQHEAQQIIERVNAFLGFAAVDRLKITQKPVKRAKTRKPKVQKPLAPQTAEKLARSLGNVEDEKLRASLKKLGTGVFREGSSKKG